MKGGILHKKRGKTAKKYHHDTKQKKEEEGGKVRSGFALRSGGKTYGFARSARISTNSEGGLQRSRQFLKY